MAVESSPSVSSVRLKPAQSQALRWLWIAFFILVIILAIKGYPGYYSAIKTVCDGSDCSSSNISAEELSEFEAAGLSTETVALISFVLLIPIPASILFIVAFIMFNRPDELVAILIAFWLLSLVVSGPMYDIIISAGTTWKLLSLSVSIIGQIALLAFVLTFPNGRFVPGWTRWLFFVLVPFIIVFETNVVFSIFGLDNPIRTTSLSGIIGLICQVYRYFRVSTAQERQQTKWIIAAFSILIVFIVLATFVLGSFVRGPYGRIVLQIVATGMVITLPLSLLFAIQRYGLWDIDFYINRGIVYASLTILLIAIFTGLFFVLQSTFTAVLGSSQPGIELVIPSLVVAALFNPARQRLRHFVDRRFYGIKMDYTRIIESRERLLQSVTSDTTIGPYRTTRVLGSGGMGEVYAGQNAQGQPVAIKVLLHKFSQDEGIEKRFSREAEATAQLEHPNIVKILDYGQDDGRMYIAMEYIEGEDWGSLLKSLGAMPLNQVLPQLEEIAAALDYVHQNGIIHRDIKPGNIMIEAGTNRAVLMDFGIAKIAAGLTAITGTSQMVGSLDYISPEQIKGEEALDHRTDIYSFGVMTYQLLTGELPFQKNNAGALVMAHLLQPPPDASIVNSDIPDSVSAAIQQAMAKQAEQRFDSLSDFIAAINLS